MLSLKEEAKSLTSKHGMNEEAMLIMQEEERLNQLLMDDNQMGSIIRYHDEQVMLQNQRGDGESQGRVLMKRTNSGQHLITEYQNRINKQRLAEATNRLYQDSSRRKQAHEQRTIQTARDQINQQDILNPQNTSKRLQRAKLKNKVMVNDKRPIHERYQDVLATWQQK